MGERYEVRGKLGRGGMSTVYRAYDTVMGREVALKRLLDLEDTNLNEDSKGALEREAGALAKFQHPNVVTVFALEEDADGPFVAMELVEGEDLNDVVKDAALSVEDFVDVAEQCLDALASAGEMNLLHRDIKPANIMLTMTPSDRFLVKILDFGLAKFSQQPSTQTLDQQGSFLGSIDYIAPEQLELRPLDQRTDLYSLGCVFYFGLTQESPFQGGNPAETSMNHINHRCTPIQEIRPDLPDHLAAWLMRLISKDPDDRPADAQAAMKQFQDAVKGISFVVDEDVPIAEVAPQPEPTRTIQTGPTRTLHTDPTGPTRTIQTGPTRSNETNPTGPTRTIQTGPTRSVQTNPTGPTRTIKTGGIKAHPSASKTSAKSVGSSVARPGGPADESLVSKFKSNPILWGSALLGLVILIGVVIVMSGAKNKESGGTSSKGFAGAGEARSEAKKFPEPSTELLPYPEVLNRSDGRPEPAKLPVNKGLVAHFVSTKGTFGRDYRSQAPVGSRIAAWYNLAKPELLSSLVRDFADKEGNKLPLIRRYTPESLPGLKAPHPGVFLSNVAAMETRSRAFDFSKGFSFVGVMVLEMGQDRFLRVVKEPRGKRSFLLGTDHKGFVYASASMGRGTKWQRIDIGWWDREPGVLGYVCDAKAATHQLSKIAKSGREETSEPGTIEMDFEGLNKFALGRRQFDSGFENPNGHTVFEFAVYDRPLSAQEMKTVQQHLFDRYLKRRE